MLVSIGDGDIIISAYDTAWVALVQDINYTKAPQFPTSLQWLPNNQLPDGSWGDPHFFLAYDRLFCTLACVVALTSWNLHPQQCHKGANFTI